MRLLCFLVCFLVTSVFGYSQFGVAQTATVDEAEKATKIAPPAAQAQPVISSTRLLPSSTKAWFSVPDIKDLNEKLDQTQFGQLGQDPSVKPFIDEIKSQAEEWLNKKNVRLGLKVEDLENIQSGEICLAGVLQDLEGGQPVRGSHGLVLLVHVGENEQSAKDLFKKINDNLVNNRGAAQEQLQINGVQVTSTTIKHPKRIRHSQTNFQTVHNGWMLTADNEEIFRDVIRRLASPESIRPETTLESQEGFKVVSTKTSLGDHPAHFRWYVNPFGYLQLAQALADEEKASRQMNDDWAAILEKQGFDAIRGIGGTLSVGTGDHEVLHRAFSYAPRKGLKQNQQRVFELFDFDNQENGPPVPAEWVPADASAYFCANWNFSKLLDNVGFVYDAFLAEGDFERMVNDFKVDPDMQLDIPKLVASIGNQITIVSATERPITETSERVVLGFPINGDSDFVFNSIKRAIGRGNSDLINLAGRKVLEVDTTKSSEPPIDYLPEDLGLEDLDDEVEEEEQEFHLFEKRYFVIEKGHLLVANDKNYLKRLLTTKQKTSLGTAEDYMQVSDALAKLTDPKNVSFRQFARIDRTLEANYEMLRRGTMGKSQTVLAKVLNQIFEHDAAKTTPRKELKDREQKLDGSKLPANYEAQIAPFLGPSGWVMEMEEDGYKMTGCILKKKPANEIVKKVDDVVKKVDDDLDDDQIDETPQR